MPYVIIKRARLPEVIHEQSAYAGISCERAGVPSGHVYDNLDVALADARKLTAVNPVGFLVCEVGQRYDAPHWKDE